MNNWRLTNGIIAFITYDGKSIYLGDPSKKKYYGLIWKSADKHTSTNLTIDNKDFSVKIINGRICISNPELPDKNKYYILENYLEIRDNSENFLQILEHNGLENGKLNETYEIMVNSDNYRVGLINKNMPIRNVVFEEMRRRLMCEMGKKTKKFKIGFRYDCLDSTLYYLGEYYSHRKLALESLFTEEGSRKVHIFVTNLRDHEKSVSDVFKSRLFITSEKIQYNNCICVKEILPPMIESGEFLINDVPDVQNIWKDMINFLIKNNEAKLGNLSELTFIKNTESAFKILDYTVNPKIEKLEPETINSIEKIIEDICKRYLIEKFNSGYFHSNLQVNTKKSRSQNIDSLVAYFYYQLQDDNKLKSEYYSKLFDKLGINPKKVAEKALDNFLGIQDSFDKDFQTYLNYENYYKNHDYSTYYKTIDLNEKTVLSDKIGNEELKDIIIKIYNENKESGGVFSERFEKINKGTSIKPRISIFCKIHLKNIIEYLGGIDNISEELKTAIIKEKLFEVSLTIDENRVIE